jgi:hypothetical protein
LRKRQLTAPEAQNATLTLHPEMSYYVNLSKEFRERTIQQGYSQTLSMASQLKQLFG